MVCGSIIWVCLAWITWLGPSFEFEIPNRNRPILLVTCLYILVSFLTLIPLFFSSVRRTKGRELLPMIVLFAIAFRLVQLFSPPFQEIDLYRYMWDGIVLSEGESPYHVSPKTAYGSLDPDEDVRVIQEIALRSDSTYQIVTRIHFEQYTTLYPPVSQLVFAGAMAIVPKEASVKFHMVVMKAVIVVFDLGIFLMVIHLLSQFQISSIWAIVYGWNPTIIKEFSNSGHLDSIAVFFVVLTMVMMVHYFRNAKQHGTSDGRIWLVLAGIFLGLGVSSKIFPIIFFPMLFCVLFFKKRERHSLVFAGAFCLSTVLSIFPMWVGAYYANRGQEVALERPLGVIAPDAVRQAPIESNDFSMRGSHYWLVNRVNPPAVPVHLAEPVTAKTESNEGLSTFLQHWQINELIFMFVYQNLRDLDAAQKTDRPWFRMTDTVTRDWVNGWLAPLVGKEQAANATARLMTLVLFGVAYSWVILLLIRSESPDRAILAAAFWTVALFFCVQPTQNPWYWTWAIPFMAFVGNRVWLLYSSFLFLYYFRFWFQIREGSFSFLGQEYSGAGYFDYVIVWIEHGVILLAVVVWELRRAKHRTRSQPGIPVKSFLTGLPCAPSQELKT